MSNFFGGVDWVEIHEPSNNQTVYISLSTGVTSEKRPLNVDIKNAYEFEWWELLDGKSNRFYYFNTRNKQTTWIKPPSNSIIPFGNVQMNCKDKFQSPLSSMLHSDVNTDFTKLQKTTHYGTAKRSSDFKSIQKRSRSPTMQSVTTDNTSTTNRSASPSIGNSENMFDELPEKLENQCNVNDDNLQSDVMSDVQSGLSSTPSIKHRPFPRTNPRSVPRRVGGAESPITYPQSIINRTSSVTENPDESSCAHSDSVRRRLGYNDSSNEDQTQFVSTTSQVNSGDSNSGQIPLTGDKLLSGQQRCQSRSSLSSAGTESTMNNIGIMSAQGQIFRNQKNIDTELQSQTVPQELMVETSTNMNNGGVYQGMSLPNTMNGYPLYDYSPGPNNTYYMTHQNYLIMQQQQQGNSGRITSTSGVSQPEAFCLRRPQSEQAISADITKQRMTMVSPRSDIVPGITQSNRYYPSTAGWVERSFSPPPTAFSSVFPQYPGPLPGWNSELFRKDQAPAKLLNWCKDSIQKPLLVSTDKILKSEACQAFKQIQGYMGDRKSKHSPTELVNSIVQKGANYYPLRDEIFMQICKQTTNNPDELSTLRGWELLRTCLNYFAPSAMFRPYLEGYVIRHLDSNHNNECPTPPKIQQAAEYTLHILSRQTNSTLRFDPNFQYQYHQQQQQQQQQMMMMAANMQTVSNQKIHLPMQLFESTDNSDDSASQRCLPLSSHFGCTVDEIMRAQYLKFPDRELPWILVTLCEEIIRRNGERTEGIFRIQADNSAVQAMCTVLDLCENVAEHPLTSSDVSPHTAACSLKRWLDSLLEPLVPPSLCNTGNQGNRPRSPIGVYHCLSQLHQVTLMYLIRFLQLLSHDDNTRINRMGPWNLAVALAPHVFQLDPGSNEYGGSRSWKRTGGSSGLDTCRSDNSANDSSGSSSRGGTASATDDSFRPHINFLYQLIVGLDTSPLNGVV